MIKHLMKALLALAVVAAMSLVGTAPATASSDGQARVGNASAKAAASCTKQRNRVLQLRKITRSADKRVKQLKVAKKKAVKKHASAKKRKAINKKLRSAGVHQRKARAKFEKSRRIMAACRAAAQDDGGSTGGGTGGSTPSPIQPACDAGLPQAICDAFGQLPLPGGSGGASPIQALCDAGLPQQICDASTAPPGTGGASPIQPLCDAGLPQAVCDAASGGGTAPDPTAVCGVLPIPGLCPGVTLPFGSSARAA